MASIASDTPISIRRRRESGFAAFRDSTRPTWMPTTATSMAVMCSTAQKRATGSRMDAAMLARMALMFGLTTK